MSHVDDGTLNALLDGELTAEEGVAVRAHLAGCAECAGRFEEAKRFLAEAADLLGALTPPSVEEWPHAAAPAPPLSAGAVPAGPPPRRVSKTAREVAIDIDGSTHKSPAIPPNFPREGEVVPIPTRGPSGRPLFEGSAPARGSRRATDWPTLAWAASVILALGVGYLANEVRHAQRFTAPGEGPVAIGPAPAAPATRTTARGGPRTPRESAGGRVKSGAAPAHRVLAAKPAAAQGRKLAQPPATEATPLADALRQPARTPAAGTEGASVQTQVAGVGAAPANAAAQERADQARRRGAAPAAGGGNLAANAPAPSPAARARPSAAAPRPIFRASDLDEASALLSGNLRYVEGLAPDGVKIGPGSLVPGADPAREVVRVVYLDPQGRRLQLDQQRFPLPPDPGPGRLARDRVTPTILGLAWGDTVATSGPGAASRLRWLDRSGLWISLSGNVPADTLRALLARVR